MNQIEMLHAANEAAGEINISFTELTPEEEGALDLQPRQNPDHAGPSKVLASNTVRHVQEFMNLHHPTAGIECRLHSRRIPELESPEPDDRIYFVRLRVA